MENVAIDCIVVGGGISGLTAAWELEQRGVRVLVLEAGLRAGGTIGSAQDRGCLVESGPSSTLATARLQALAAAVGLREALLYARPVGAHRYILRDGILTALPSSPLALLTTPLFSGRAKWRLLREPFVARAAAEESVASFVRRRLGSEALDYAVDPFVAGVCAGAPEQLSLKAAFPRLYQLEQEHGSLLRGQLAHARARSGSGRQAMPAMLSFRDGMQTLTDALARRMDRIELDARALSVSVQRGGFEVVAGNAAGTRSYRARSLLLATPAYSAAELVEPFAQAAGAALRAIPYAPVAVVASAYHRGAIAHPLDGYGFLVPRREQRLILGSIFSSALFENRAPAGIDLLTTFVGGMRQPDLAARAPDQIAELVAAELQALLGARGAPALVHVTRWERAIPQYTLGHLGRIAQVEQAERDFPGLFFGANYRGGIAIGNCIDSAHAIAERVAAFLAGISATGDRLPP